jgi:hypothetical protein
VLVHGTHSRTDRPNTTAINHSLAAHGIGTARGRRLAEPRRVAPRTMRGHQLHSRTAKCDLDAEQVAARQCRRLPVCDVTARRTSGLRAVIKIQRRRRGMEWNEEGRSSPERCDVCAGCMPAAAPEVIPTTLRLKEWQKELGSKYKRCTRCNGDYVVYRRGRPEMSIAILLMLHTVTRMLGLKNVTDLYLV